LQDRGTASKLLQHERLFGTLRRGKVSKSCAFSERMTICKIYCSITFTVPCNLGARGHRQRIFGAVRDSTRLMPADGSRTSREIWSYK